MGWPNCAVGHELAHGPLLHKLNHRGCRQWDQSIEDEANWLAGALLITEDGALMIVRRSLTELHAAAMFGVTTSLVRYPVNVTGARARVARTGVGDAGHVVRRELGCKYVSSAPPQWASSRALRSPSLRPTEDHNCSAASLVRTVV